MVHCEYCLSDIPKGEKTTKYFFIVIDAGEILPKNTKDMKQHVEDNHHQISVCSKCENHIFVERKFHTEKSPSPKRKSSPKKKSPSPKRKSSPKKKSPSPKRKSSPKKKSPSPKPFFLKTNPSPKKKTSSKKKSPSPKKKTSSPKKKPSPKKLSQPSRRSRATKKK
jgi:hypothetical protein